MRKPFTPKPDAERKIDVVFVKAGYEIDGVGRPKVGDTVALPSDQARSAVLAVVAEFAGAL